MHQTSSSKSRLRILVVEDEFLIRMMVSEGFREAGYQVCEAANADWALRLIESFTPDLIVTDVQMPGSINGLEMLATVRRSYPVLPVIVTSGHLAASDIPVDDRTFFWPKPVAFVKLIAVVQNTIGPAA